MMAKYVIREQHGFLVAFHRPVKIWQNK
ncbi:hypothetical protein DESC_780276 [Desulfosarcina cetonica]|nr:hypothetical protein DESC_780276 [Desulfosarcina cetonica]